jgi:catechol 2,3-dioxygenase-like lactoylglutathione lyase family enzyme
MAWTFNHVGMTVSDIDRTTKYYEALGFVRSFEEPHDFDTDWIKAMTKMPDAHVKIQMLKFDGVVLELLEYVKPAGVNQAGMPTSNPGSAHVAIGVDDLIAEHARLVKAGIKFRSDPVIILEGPFAGVKAVYAEDPDGYTVEFLEWKG